MRILVDMDDTIEYLLDAWILELNKRYNQNVRLSDCSDWDMRKLYPNLNPDQIYGVLGDEEFWKNVRPAEGASPTLKRLSDEGHEICIVTAPAYSAGYRDIGFKKKYILDKYFPFIDRGNIIVSSRKQLIIGDVMVDDYINNLIGGNYRKILFTSQHNLGVALTPDIARANNWDEVYVLIHKMQAG